MQMVQPTMPRRIESFVESPSALGSLWVLGAMLGLPPSPAQVEHRTVWWSSEFFYGGGKCSRELWAVQNTSLANLHTLLYSYSHLINNSRLGSSLSLLPPSHSILLLHKSWAILVEPLGITEEKGKWTRAIYFFFPIDFQSPPKPYELSQHCDYWEDRWFEHLDLWVFSPYTSPNTSFFLPPFSWAKLLTIKRNYLPSGFDLILSVFIAV